MIDSLTKLTKNVTFLIATLATGVSSLLFFIEEYRFELGQYDVLIGVSLFFILLTVAVVAHFKTQTKICKLRDGVNEGFEAIQIAMLISDVEQFYDKNIKYESLRLHQSQRLHELEKRRANLKVNSFTQMKLSLLLKKPIDDRNENH